jgi:hypothetical protein
MLPYGNLSLLPAIAIESDAALVSIRSFVCRQAFFVPGGLTNGDFFALVAFRQALMGLLWAMIMSD